MRATRSGGAVNTRTTRRVACIKGKGKGGRLKEGKRKFWVFTFRTQQQLSNQCYVRCVRYLLVLHVRSQPKRQYPADSSHPFSNFYQKKEQLGSITNKKKEPSCFVTARRAYTNADDRGCNFARSRLKSRMTAFPFSRDQEYQSSEISLRMISNEHQVNLSDFSSIGNIHYRYSCM